MRRVKVGEYEVIEDLKNGTFKALRHGLEWKDLIGDNLTMALIDRINELEEESAELLEENAKLLTEGLF